MKIHAEMMHVLRRFTEVLDKGHLAKALKTSEFEMLSQALDGWNYMGRAVTSGDPCGEKLMLKLDDLRDRKMAPERLPDKGDHLHEGCELFTTTHGNRWIVFQDQADGEWYWFKAGEHPSKWAGTYSGREETLAALKAHIEDPAKVTKARLREWFRSRGFTWVKPTENVENPTCGECKVGEPATLYWDKERIIFCSDCLAKHLREHT
jgi:hypothetical protein